MHNKTTVQQQIMAENKNKMNDKEEEEVKLERRSILDNRCSILVPSPITNSGKADGGFMDRIGITEAGLGHLFEPPNALNPIDCFYSNDAYAKAGFCTIHLELHPPLERIGDDTESSTLASLTNYLKGYCHDTENDYYKNGEYTDLHASPFISDPLAVIGSKANTIVQIAFEVPVTPGPNLPAGLTSTKYVALIHFANKGNVLFKANNFNRHSPPINYNTILSSIEYTSDRPYHGADPTFSGLQSMDALFQSNGNIKDARKVMARAKCQDIDRAGGDEPTYCLQCGASKTPNDNDLLKCSRCKVATYCSRECQRKDWKRHKHTECHQ